MRRRALLTLALLLALPAIANAGLRAQCRQSCFRAIDDCVITGRHLRACKRNVLRRSRQQGLQVCIPSTTTTITTTPTTTTPAFTTTTIPASVCSDPAYPVYCSGFGGACCQIGRAHV